MKNLLPLLFILVSCSSIKEAPSLNLKVSSIDGKYEMNDCVEDWSIAQLQGLPNEVAQKKINDFLSSKIAEKSCDHSEDVAGETYGLKIVSDKIFSNYIVFESNATFNTGGPEAKLNSTCLVFDLNTGNKVEFEVLLNTDYQKVVDELVVKQIWEGKASEAEEYKHVLSASKKSLVEIMSHKVCPNGKGLVLQFSTMEIAPASHKNPEILIDQKTWPKIFKRNAMTREVFGDF